MRSDYGYSAVIFPCVWIVIGNYILLNLFLALVLEMFANNEEDDELVDSSFSSSRNMKESVFGSSASRSKRKKQEKLKMIEELSISDSESDYNNSKNLEDLKKESQRRKQKPLYVGIESIRSFFIFAKHNPIRLFCYRFSSSHTFENFILLFISLSTVKLIWDTYLLQKSDDDIQVVLSQYFDVAFTVVFTLEMIIKQISMGFVMSKGSYLRDSWCQLDMLIVGLSILDLSMSNFDLAVIKVLRLLRTLRPLRIISHNVSMKIIINALIESLISVFNVAIVMFVV